VTPFPAGSNDVSGRDVLVLPVANTHSANFARGQSLVGSPQLRSLVDHVPTSVGVVATVQCIDLASQVQS